MLAASEQPGFRPAEDRPIPFPMRKGGRVEEIAEAFAEAVAQGDFRAAEGWIAVARFVESAEPDPSQAREREPGRADRRHRPS